jgi:hypothetical protein
MFVQPDVQLGWGSSVQCSNSGRVSEAALKTPRVDNEP